MNFTLKDIRRALYQGSALSSKKASYLYAAFGALFFCALGLFAWYFYSDAKQWYRMTPEVIIERGEWQAILDPNPNFNPLVANSWREAKALTDPNTSNALRNGQISQLWLRLIIPKEKILRAAATQSFYFRLGWLLGNIDAWVDDQHLIAIPANYTGTIDLAIPIERFSQAHDLVLTLKMIPRPGAKNLVPLTIGMKGGLVSYNTGAAYQRFNHFIGRSRPLALFFVYTVFAGIFFLLWLNSQVQQEYFHLACFALINAMPEILFSDSFTTNKLHDGPAIYCYLFLLVLKAVSGLNLGFAFARSKPKGYRTTIFALFLGGLALLGTLSVPQLSAMRQTLNQLMIPAVFLLGAGVCLLQSIGLNAQPQRKKHLWAFSGILFGLSVLYWVQFHVNFDYVTKQLMLGIPDLSFILFLGYLAATDFREQSQLVKKIPISSYHRRTNLPAQLSGAVLMMDLKNSELLFATESLVPTVLSHIWAQIAQNGGTIIKAEGDEVIAFFDAEKIQNPLAIALATTDDVSNALKILAEELGLASVHYRAAVALGEIKPTWVGQGNARLPAWNQVGETMVFVDAARLMDIEKQLPSEGVKTRVLVQSSAFHKFPVLESTLKGFFSRRQHRHMAKHDRIYMLDVYETQAAPAIQIRLKAA